MRRALLILICLLTVPVFAFAQDPDEPDYAVYVVDRQVSETAGTTVLQFGVYNIGAAATQTTSARLFVENDDDRLIGTETVRPIRDASDTEILTFSIPLDELPGGNVTFRLEVGIADIEPIDSATIGNNTARVGITVPGNATPIRRTPSPTIPPSPTASAATDVPAATPTLEPIRIPVLDIAIDPGVLRVENPWIILGAVALCGVGLILLWVLTVILRLLFRTPPVFEAWHPPYPISAPADPNTLSGRRQMWQQSAQSDHLPSACVEGHYAIRKRLVGIDGSLLGGWRVRGIRLSQYDSYGRVARSQALASSRMAGRLNRAVRKAASLTKDEAERRTRPIARQMVSQFVRVINKRSAMLPVACDIRFRGTHGEVRIQFELFQCVNGVQQPVDHWEPEMTIVTGGIQENYTYSFSGMRQGETNRSFRQRLQEELTRALAAMIHNPVPAALMGDTANMQPVAAIPIDAPASNSPSNRP